MSESQVQSGGAAQPRGSRKKRRVFLESRYQKLVRGLPQTIFYCPDCKGDRRRRKGCERCEGFGKLYKDSVQELIGRRLLPAFKAKFGKFHGAGREDVDVRMLGSGRPFVYEVVEPRRDDVDLEALLADLHERDGDRLQLEPFRLVEKPRVVELKEAEYRKVYRVLVVFDEAVDSARIESLAGKEFDIVQRTPQRVAHRRGDLERERHVAVRKSVVHGDASRGALIEIECQHGTYVKEWISGDDARTTPSLAGLLEVGACCQELDVLEILDRVAGGSAGGPIGGPAAGSV